MKGTLVPEEADAAAAPRKGRTAVVLGGGGITGGVFELGALRALDAALVGSGVCDVDIVVGVSCGAVMGSHIAAGIRPDALMQSLGGRGPLVPPFERGRVLKPDWRELGRRASLVPKRVLDALWLYARGRGDISLPDALMGLGELIPAGVLDGAGLEGFVHDNLVTTPCRDRFDGLTRELYIVAVDVDTGQRAVFGSHDMRDMPISKAVRASASFPPALAPTRINGRDYVDGGVEKNYHVDIAIAAGARLIIVVNPFVPLMNDPARFAVRLMSGRQARIVDKGMPAVVDQTLRMIMNSRTAEDVEELRRRHPDVDILMLEPAPDDYAMFFYNVARFSARIHIAQHGYATARARLLRNFDELRALFRQYNLTLSRDLLDREYEAIEGAGFSLDGVMRTLGHVPSWRLATTSSAPSRLNPGRGPARQSTSSPARTPA
ncbi:MAG: patatin-like phospholipase family protein [Myxococcota bacterium]